MGGAKGSLQASVDELAFPKTYVGHPTEAELRLTNTGRAALYFELQVEGAFRATLSSGKIAGGSAMDLRLRFDPQLPGAYAETLEISFEGQRLAVALTGEAVPPPPCRGSGPCRSVTFDPIEERCVEEWLDDDTLCISANACMVEERCFEGACIGIPRSCDDGDLCTVKACDPELGCVAQPVECPAPDEACRVAACDSATGCGSAPAPDGTPCGPASCESAHVCWGGTCREASVPEGFPCAADCGEGGCRDGRCHREEGEVLSLAWKLSTEAELAFPGLVDDLGNLYWLECQACDEEGEEEEEGGEPCAPSCSLVSVTPEGFERYRVLLGSDFLAPGSFDRLALVGAELWVAEDEGIRALPTRDGIQSWAVAFFELGLEGARPLAILRSGGGAIVQLEVDGRSRFVALGEGGALEGEWTLGPGETPSLAVADAAGQLYLGLDSGERREIASFTVSGEERWRRPSLGGGRPIAVSSGLLLVAGESALHAYRSSDGSHLGSWDVAAEAAAISLQQGYLLEAEAELSSLDPQDRSLLPLQIGEEGLSLGEPALSGAQRALFLAGGEVEAVAGWFIGEAGPGYETRLCLLPETDAPQPRWSLAMGRLCVATEASVRCYELPERKLADEGWITPWGSPLGGRAGR